MEDYTIAKKQLISTPLPLQTRTYKPVPHQRLIDLTLEALLKEGFTVDREIYASAKGGLVAYGKYVIGNVSDNEMRLQIMWQNSYDKTKVLTFAIGALVLVCTNGMVSFRSANSFRKKHTGEIQEITPHVVQSYIAQAAETFLTLQQDRDIMKTIEIDRKTTAELIGRMYIEHEFIESTQLNIIKRQLDKPAHDYGAPGSLWELYQHTTYAIGGIHPSHWMEDHIAAHEFFVNAAGILVQNDVVVVPEYKIEDPNQLAIDFDEIAAEEEKVEHFTEPEPIIVPEPQLIRYKVVIMSDDPDLLDTDDPHQKYVQMVDAYDEQEATVKALDQFAEEYGDLPIYWSKVYAI